MRQNTLTLQIMSDDSVLESKEDSFENHPNFSVFILGNTTCRACLTQDEDMQPLFCNQEWFSFNPGYDVLNMFISCTALKVAADDSYPKHLCNSCFKELVEAYSFWKKCRQSVEEMDRLNTELNSVENKHRTDNFDVLYDEQEVAISTDDHPYSASRKTPNCEDSVITKEPECRADIQHKLVSIFLDNNNTLDVDIDVESNNNSNNFSAHLKNSDSSFLKEYQKPKCTRCQLTFSDRKQYKYHWHKCHSRQAQFKKFTDSQETVKQDKLVMTSESFEDDAENYPKQSPDQCDFSRIFDNNEEETETIFINRCGKDDKVVVLTNEFEQSREFDDGVSVVDCSPDLNSFDIICQDSQNLPSNKKMHKCRTCDIYFNTKEEHRRHYLIHSQRLCSICGFITSSSSCFQEHLKIHSDLRPYKCQTCNRKYKSISSLKVHETTHIGELKYACNHCDRKFVTWSSRFSHIRAKHTPYDKHVCGFCSKGFPDANKLKVHVRRHTGEKPYSCEECGMAFIERKNLQNHMVSHTGIRNFVCGLCDKRFLLSKHLKQHMITHTGERKHKCEVCGKSYTQAQVLRNHAKMHKKPEDSLSAIENEDHN